MENFTGTEFGNKVGTFTKPTQLPKDETQQAQWQASNKGWWEATPMRYDWREKIDAEPGTEAYYREVDARFFSASRKSMPWKAVPFDQFVPFATLKDKDVLEIGVGQGSHAQLIAPYAKTFTGIDLTEHASASTRKRLGLFNIPATIHQMDAEKMQFPDNSFDYIWSWGVIHHSANTHKVLEEMHRVLRCGGCATIMVYYRSWWHFWLGGMLRGLFQGQFFKGRSFHDICQGATDGAIARFYTPAEWREETKGLFENDAIAIYGLKSELLPIPGSHFKNFLEDLMPNFLAALLTHNARLGSFLVAQMHKV